MPTSCTIFSVTASELAQYIGEITGSDLPPYDSAVTKISTASRSRTLQLGEHWEALHVALGNRHGRHPLAFMVSGGERVVALDDGPRSSGRQFSPHATASILAAVEDIYDHDLPAAVHKTIAALHLFLADVVAADRGIIVHQFV